MPYLDEKRRADRVPLGCTVGINDRRSFPDGIVQDISKKGVAVQYPPHAGTTECPLEVGETVPLAIDGFSVVPGRVTRKFEGGFAVALDVELDIEAIVR